MRRLSVLGAMLVWLMARASAQSGSTDRLPPPYRGVQNIVPGIFLTPVANAPFSGNVEIVSHEKLQDGAEYVTTARNHLARASSGRIYQERHPMASVDLLGKTPILSEHIYDPNNRQSIMLFPMRHLAREIYLRGPEPIPQTALPPSQQPKPPGIVQTDLGTETMDDLQLQGMRREQTVPAELSGTGAAVIITDEYWYSPALSIYVIIRHNDPRTGEQLIAVKGVERAEPPAGQFAIPADYKLVDETTPEAPVAAQ